MCVGGGLEVVLACDLIWAAASARFGRNDGSATAALAAPTSNDATQAAGNFHVPTSHYGRMP